MALTALIGSQLSVRAQRLAQEAIHRREEMERLNELGSVLLAANTLAEAAAHAVREVVELFGLRGAVLRVEGVPDAFQSGDFSPAAPRIRFQSYLSVRSLARMYWNYTGPASRKKSGVRSPA